MYIIIGCIVKYDLKVLDSLSRAHTAMAQRLTLRKYKAYTAGQISQIYPGQECEYAKTENQFYSAKKTRVSQRKNHLTPSVNLI